MTAQPAPIEFRPCVVIPTYNNPDTVRSVVERVRAHDVPVVVVDDGSGPRGRAVVEQIGRDGLAHVHHQDNRGKGGACKTGFRVAAELGYSHALQVDADGQHAIEDIGKFLDAAREQPQKLVVAFPVFDDSVPWIRLNARKITLFLTHVETLGRHIKDSMCGFRVYPLEPTLRVAPTCGDWMDFDMEIAVKLVWAGVGVVNLPTRVSYPEDGVSHFRMVADNAKITWMHTRLIVGAIGVGLMRLFGKRPYAART